MAITVYSIETQYSIVTLLHSNIIAYNSIETKLHTNINAYHSIVTSLHIIA